MDSFNFDNTVLNSIAVGEYGVVMKTDPPYEKKSKYQLKNVITAKTSSSGISSLPSLEDYEVENCYSIQNEGTAKFNKRSIESILPGVQKKKLKWDEATTQYNKLNETVLESTLDSVNIRSIESILPGVQKKKLKWDEATTQYNKLNETVLESTLDSVNITKIMEKNSESENTEFDAFANYLNKECTPQNRIDRSAFIRKKKSTCRANNLIERSAIFSSQFLSTQAIRQLDAEVNSDKITEAIETDNVMEMTDTVANLPLLLSFQEKNKSRDSSTKFSSVDEKIPNKSALSENDKVTSQYRQQVDNLFEQIEHSIYAMGTTNAEQGVPDGILDIIFSDDLKPPEDGKSEKNEQPAECTEDSISNNMSFNMSFGSVIRKAMMNNATKSYSKKIVDNSLNVTVIDKNAEFHCLGPFYGLPLKVKDLIQQFKGIEELYDWQDECLKLPAIKNKSNLIYALPTSGGKTLVAEILIFREIMCYRRNAILILPYVSIVQEKVWALSPFGIALDFLVEEYASSKGAYPPRKRRRKHSVYIATIEKALGIINSLIETGRLDEIGLIVVDELHLVGEDGRGATLEACLTKIMFLKANIQIIGMSATIGNLPEICEFLNSEAYTKNFRPVELSEYVKCGNEIAKINWNYTSEDNLLKEPKKIDYKYSENILKLDPDMLGGLVTDIVPKGSCLIFCASKKNCENVANLLCKMCKPGLKNYRMTEKEQLLYALKDQSGELCEILSVSVQYGIAYHHSGLTSDERRIIEEGFRAGVLYVICCTSTLAAGVNLPARRVILRSPYIGKDFINLSRYKQMVGRAGRAGLGEAGDSILITNPLDLPKVKKLLMSPMNRALSSMHVSEGKGLRHLLLSCISLGIANTRIQLQNVTTHTLLSVQSKKLEVNIKTLTDQIIKNLFKLGALKESSGKQEKHSSVGIGNISVRMNTSIPDTLDDKCNYETKKQKKTIMLTNSTKLVVSELGCAAIKGGLELSKAHILYEDLYQAQSCLVLQGHLHLLYLVTPYDTAERIKPNFQIYYDVFSRLKLNEVKVARTLGLNESVAVKMLSNKSIKNIPERILNRFYLTLMLYDLWNEMPVFHVSEKYQVNRGIVQNLMTSTATFASNVVNFCEELEEFWAFAHLLRGMNQRLSHCCVQELLPLMELPAVKQSRAKQLYNAGYKTLQSIAKASADDLVDSIEFMSRRVAIQLVAASKMLLLEKVENLREEAEDVLDGVEKPRHIFNQTKIS